MHLTVLELARFVIDKPTGSQNGLELSTEIVASSESLSE